MMPRPISVDDSVFWCWRYGKPLWELTQFIWWLHTEHQLVDQANQLGCKFTGRSSPLLVIITLYLGWKLILLCCLVKNRRFSQPRHCSKCVSSAVYCSSCCDKQVQSALYCWRHWAACRCCTTVPSLPSLLSCSNSCLLLFHSFHSRSDCHAVSVACYSVTAVMYLQYFQLFVDVAGCWCHVDSG